MQEDESYLNKRGLTHFWENIDALKQDKLTAGANITIASDNTISASQPTVNNATLTIQKEGTSVGTFTANASTNSTVNIIETDPTVPAWAKASSKPSYSWTEITNKPTIPTKTSDLTNDSGFLTSTDYATASTGGVIKVGGGLEITNGVLSATGGGTADAVEWANVLNRPTDVSYWTNDAGYITSSALPTVGNATLTIQKNGTSAGTFTANATSNKTINITVPTTAADVSALPASTKYGASIAVSINTTDYKVTTTLKDQDGNTLGTAQVIDLPLESVVVNGSYDNTNKKIVLTLQSGSTIDIPVADLVAGLQSEITSTNKLASDLVDDTNQTHKFMTSAEKTKLSGIATGAEVNVQSDWTQTDNTADDYIKNKPTLATVATSGSYNDLSNKPTIPTVNNATLTIQKNGANVQTFTANQSTNATANITVPTDNNELANGAGYITSSGTAAKANQLTTGRTIAISGGATGTATSFNGTSNISIPVTKLYETYLDWGNQVKNSSVSLIDAAMGEDFSANRLAYLPASCITIEYSRDAGATWTAYTATDAQKIGLVTTSQSFYTGGTSTLESGTTRLRITIAPGNNLYMTTRKLLVNISTGGVENAQMIIEKRAMGAADFTVVREATAITGWSGWNSFPLNITYGGTASWSNDAIRLTFFFDGKSASYPNAQLNVSRIRLFGETAWSAPSNLAKNGHMYTYDTAQNVTFPATVKATFFDGPTKYAQYLEGNGRITSANLDHFTANNDVHQRLDIVSSSMSAANGKPAGDGFLTTYTWDNSGNYDTQVYYPNAIGTNGGRPQIRFKADTSSTFNWSSWKSLAYLDDIPTVPTNVSAFTNDAGYLTSIPTASASTLGGIKVGSGLSISNGVLSTQSTAPDWSDITNKPTFATVATSGSYNDLTNKPTIPTVNNGTLTIQKNGTNVQTFTANQSGNATANITVPTAVSELNNDSGYQTAAQVQTAVDGKQDELTAGDHIDITNDVISATDYVHSENPVSTTEVTPIVTGSMISNGTITADKLATGATIQLTLSTTDIGEGAALAANTLYGVYQ